MIDLLSNPLVAAVLGFMGGMWGLIGLEVWRERRRAVQVRTLLRQEIAQNIASLTYLDHQLPSSGPVSGDQPGAVLEQLVWTGQMPVLPSVLGNREIVVLSGFYDGLHRISMLNDMLRTPTAQVGSDSRLSEANAHIRTLLPRTIKAGTLGFELLGQPH